MIRAEAMRASNERLNFALYEWNMGDANVGPPSLAGYVASLLSRHFKCKLQRNLGVGRAHKEHMAELIKAIKRLSDDAVAAYLEHHLLHTLRTID
jgi:DNA-binding GntR family transcriptional regulator